MSEPNPDFPRDPGGPRIEDRSEAAQARALIESQGLRFEPDWDDLVVLREGGRVVACAARAGYVLKMVTIAPDHQGGDLLGELVTRLVESARAAGHETVFVFTAPANAPSFQALNFRLLAVRGEAALLEHGPGLEAYLAVHAAEIRPGANGAVVVNGNPFTRGHLHLVEQAARAVDRLYLFVVREDRSLFPFPVRFRLAREATAHLANVTVLDTSRYAVSAATFPSYFLKRLDQAATAQMGVDLELFASRLAPRFHIVRRFAGAEPLDPTTAAYNRMMGEILPAHGIQWTELPRLEADGRPISATRIRAAFRDGDLDAVAGLLPATTLAFLRSPEAAPIAVRLRAGKENP